MVIEYYGTASEVPWLFLLSNWIIAFIVVSLAYAWWNESGLRLHLHVNRATPAPSSPIDNLSEHVLRSAPMPTPIFEGDGLNMEIGLDTTRSPRGPARLTGLIGSEPLSAATGLVPRSGWRHQVALQGLRRGPVGAHSWVVESSDPLGMFRSRRTNPDAEVALVLPRFTSLAHRPQTRELEASVAAPRSGSGTELFGVREYRPGDSLRRIHWRSSARHGELVVREYEPPGVQTLGIFCDPKPASTEVADQVARLAASEAWDCLRNGGRVVLWGPGLVPTSPGESRSIWSLLEWLARYPAPADAGEDADPPLVSEAVAVTGGARQELVDALEVVRRRGGTVRAWVVEPGARRAPFKIDVEVDLDGAVQHVGTDWPL